MRKLILYSLILTGIISTIISCSKSGGETPVQPPKDTTTTQPPNDTTSTGTDTTGSNQNAKHFIPLSVMSSLIINLGKGGYVEQFGDGGYATDGKTDGLQSDTRLGSDVSQRFVNPGNAQPVATTDAGNGDALLTYPNRSVIPFYQTEPVADTGKYINFQFTKGDTTYIVFPVDALRLRGFAGTPNDSTVRVFGNIPSAFDGRIAHQ